MPPLSAITFDLWETLILDSSALQEPRIQKRIQGVLEALQGEGLDVTREQLTQASRECLRICGEVREQEGDVSFDEQIDIFLRSVDDRLPERIRPETRTQVARRYADSLLEYPPLVADGARRVMRALKGMGYKIGLICNTSTTPGATQRVFLRRVGLAEFFDTLTFSDEERLSKPSARIFHLTLERMQATPEQTVHVGDHPRNDVAGAKRAGLRAIWLRRDDQAPVVEPDARIASLDEVPSALAALARQAERRPSP